MVAGRAFAGLEQAEGKKKDILPYKQIANSKSKVK